MPDIDPAGLPGTPSPKFENSGTRNPAEVGVGIVVDIIEIFTLYTRSSECYPEVLEEWFNGNIVSNLVNNPYLEIRRKFVDFLISIPSKGILERMLFKMKVRSREKKPFKI